MTFLPIVERELRVAARRRGTYWNRALAALSAILVFAGTLWFEGRMAPKELGKDVFRVLSGLFLFSSPDGIQDLQSREIFQRPAEANAAVLAQFHDSRLAQAIERAHAHRQTESLLAAEFLRRDFFGG